MNRQLKGVSEMTKENKKEVFYQSQEDLDNQKLTPREELFLDLEDMLMANPHYRDYFFKSCMQEPEIREVILTVFYEFLTVHIDQKDDLDEVIKKFESEN